MASPALPQVPKTYDQDYFIEFNRVLRLYFTGQLDVPIATNEQANIAANQIYGPRETSDIALQALNGNSNDILASQIFGA